MYPKLKCFSEEASGFAVPQIYILPLQNGGCIFPFSQYCLRYSQAAKALISYYHSLPFHYFPVVAFDIDIDTPAIFTCRTALMAFDRQSLTSPQPSSPSCFASPLSLLLPSWGCCFPSSGLKKYVCLIFF